MTHIVQATEINEVLLKRIEDLEKNLKNNNYHKIKRFIITNHIIIIHWIVIFCLVLYICLYNTNNTSIVRYQDRQQNGNLKQNCYYYTLHSPNDYNSFMYKSIKEKLGIHFKGVCSTDMGSLILSFNRSAEC